MANQDLSHIIEFYGETCPHCLSMKPTIRELETELDGEITKLEVWNHEENKATMKKYESIISEACGGFAAVPSFVNTLTGQALCGEHEKQDLKFLIEGGDCTGNKCMPHTPMHAAPNATAGADTAAALEAKTEEPSNG